MIKLPSLAIVVPCFNEEEVLDVTSDALLKVIDSLLQDKKIDNESRIYFVDDGSSDKTWEQLTELSKKNSKIISIKLSKNKGHQRALYAGLCSTTEDIVISIDADLQDDPENIIAMVEQYHKGFDVVFGVRAKRETDTWFKRITAQSYYKAMKAVGVDLIYNHADFRLTSRRALESFKEYPESNLFLRGIAREIGYPWTTVKYARKERFAGESKYPLKKMLSFAWDGITSFSSVPLRAITILGFSAGCLSVVTLLWVLFTRLINDTAVPGWASILLPLLFIGSVQLICLGVLGEYLAKIYAEVKRRPKYHIEKTLNKRD